MKYFLDKEYENENNKLEKWKARYNKKVNIETQNTLTVILLIIFIILIITALNLPFFQ